MSRCFIKPVMLVVIATHALPACKGRVSKSNAETKEALSEKETAWFVGGDRPIKVCIQTSPKILEQWNDRYGNGLSEGARTVLLAYASWSAYLVRKGAEPDYYLDEARMAKGLSRYISEKGGPWGLKEAYELGIRYIGLETPSTNIDGNGNKDSPHRFAHLLPKGRKVRFQRSKRWMK